MYHRTQKTLLNLILALMVGLMVACTPTGNDGGNAAATPTTDPNAPVSSDDPTTEPEPTGEIITGTAMIDSVDLLMLESFPLQMTAHVTGNYPDGCTGLGTVTQERVENIITITVETARPADRMCTEALVPFAENISVDINGLLAGEYAVIVNGVEATFTLDTDNVLP
jgi:inhibitor of cysteine peptidase